MCGPLDDPWHFAARNGQFTATRASVEIDLDCGNVTVVAEGGTGWRLEGDDATGDGPTIEADASSLPDRLGSDADRGPFGWLGSREHWSVGLPTGPRLDLDAEIDAGTATFDLTGADIGTAGPRDECRERHDGPARRPERRPTSRSR